MTQRWATIVVEDDPALRDLMRRILEKLNFDVRLACDGHQAKEIGETEAERTDLLITNIRTHGVDGVTLAARLTALQPRIRVLFMIDRTGTSAFPWEHVPSLHSAFVEKPFSQAELVRQIDTLLEGPLLKLVNF